MVSEACGLGTSVTDWVIDHPEIVPLLERLGIDYACGGRSLEWACHQRGVDPRDVLRQVDEHLGIRR